MDIEGYYRQRWKYEERGGNFAYAELLKSKYKELVMIRLKKPYKEYHERIKQFPMINLN